jgi:hypothetical protein
MTTRAAQRRRNLLVGVLLSEEAARPNEGTRWSIIKAMRPGKVVRPFGFTQWKQVSDSIESGGEVMVVWTDGSRSFMRADFPVEVERGT